LFAALDVGRGRPRGTAASDRVVAKSEIGADRRRGAEALTTILHTPSIKKSDLPDPLELSNGFGLRSQSKIKE
jgi:hypothetical protein